MVGCYVTPSSQSWWRAVSVHLPCLVLSAIVLNTIGRARSRSIPCSAVRMEGDTPAHAHPDGTWMEDRHAPDPRRYHRLRRPGSATSCRRTPTALYDRPADGCQRLPHVGVALP